MIDPSGILMIEPSSKVSATPVIDELTRKMAAALRGAERGMSSNGFHICACGARSGDTELLVQDREGRKYPTNALAVHYLAFHRSEVPSADLERVRGLDCGEVNPEPKELQEDRLRKVQARIAKVLKRKPEELFGA